MPPNDTTELRRVDEDYCIATWGHLLVLIWRNRTTEAGLAAVREEFTRLTRRHDIVGLLTVVEMNAPLPAAPVRKLMADFLAEQASHIRRSAVVFEGSGFRSAAVRGVVTGLTLLARPPYPHKVFSSVREASVWMAAEPLAPGVKLVGEALLHSVEVVRGRVAQGIAV